MERKYRLNALLVEIMIAVLFFALSATVILDCFSAARRLSAEAEMESEALLAAQNLAEAIYAREQPEAFLEKQGFQFENGLWRQKDAAWALGFQMKEEDIGSGVLLSARVQVYKESEMIAELPCSRYLPKEVI